jgi:hypothetical protein
MTQDKIQSRNKVNKMNSLETNGFSRTHILHKVTYITGSYLMQYP